MQRITLVIHVVLIMGCARTTPIPASNNDGGKPVVDNNVGGENDPPEVKQQRALKKELAALPPVDPVPFEKLLELIPPRIEQFEGTAGSGHIDPTGALSGVKYSTAERRFSKDDKSIRMFIMDHAHQPDRYVNFTEIRP